MNKFDASSFLRGLDLMNKRIRAGAEIGMGRAVNRALRDATMEIPATPKLDGDLRGSGSAIVDNKVILTGLDLGYTESEDARGHATESPEHSDRNRIVGVVGFNAPYAAYQHEGRREDGTHVVKQHTTAGTGTKFLERPLIDNSDRYLKIVAQSVRKAERNA